MSRLGSEAASREEEIVDHALCATLWKQSSRSLFIMNVIQAIRSLEDQRFEVTELESLTTIMQRRVESLNLRGTQPL